MTGGSQLVHRRRDPPLESERDYPPRDRQNHFAEGRGKPVDDCGVYRYGQISEGTVPLLADRPIPGDQLVSGLVLLGENDRMQVVTAVRSGVDRLHLGGVHDGAIAQVDRGRWFYTGPHHEFRRVAGLKYRDEEDRIHDAHFVVAWLGTELRGAMVSDRVDLWCPIHERVDLGRLIGPTSSLVCSLCGGEIEEWSREHYLDVATVTSSLRSGHE